MAQKILVSLVDDLDGGDATTTVHFTYKGQAYEIDLSDKNVARFDKAMESWTHAARKAKKGSLRAVRGSAGRVGPDPKDVRLWASMSGVEVPARGRIPVGVVEQYEAANG